MTQQQQNKQLRKWSRFQQKYEKYYAKKFHAALNFQIDVYLKTQDLMAIPSFPIYDILKNLYLVVGTSWVGSNKRVVTKAASGSMGVNEELARLIANYYGTDLLNTAEGITDYTREVIRKILIDATRTGIGFDEITREITALDSSINAMRAKRIARTETVTSANGAAMINAKIYADKNNSVLIKTWIAITDKRTRHNHRDINGRAIPIEEPFILGKYADLKMMQPGARTQPNGLSVPASEVVNCRCTVGFESKRDANGRIIVRK